MIEIWRSRPQAEDVRPISGLQRRRLGRSRWSGDGIGLPDDPEIGYRCLMGMERHILRLLLAAIVMIAAQFLPSVASAHDGHGHGAHAAHHTPTPVPSVAPVMAHDVVSIGASTGMTAIAPVHGRVACTPGCLACAGGTACCGCGAMILPAAAGLPQRAGLPIAVAAPDVPTPTGIGPEALHEPPRPIA